MNNATELAQKIVEKVFESFSSASRTATRMLALDIVRAVPELNTANQAHAQYIFDLLVGAAATDQVARERAKTARHLA